MPKWWALWLGRYHTSCYGVRLLPYVVTDIIYFNPHTMTKILWTNYVPDIHHYLFQSTHLCRVRPNVSSIAWFVAFQSTHPCGVRQYIPAPLVVLSVLTSSDFPLFCHRVSITGPHLKRERSRVLMCDEGSRIKLSYNDYITILSKMQAKPSCRKKCGLMV